MNLKTLLISLFVAGNILLAQASGNPGTRQFRIPQGVTTADMVQGTIIFKLKPEYRSLARTTAVNHQKLNSVLAAMGATRVAKKFPAKSAPASEKNSMGQSLVDLSLIYQVEFSSNESIEKLVNDLLKTGVVAYAEP